MIDRAPIIEEIKGLSHLKRVVLIAVDGVGGAGKTTQAEILKKKLAKSAIVHLDDFYAPAFHATDLLRLKNQVLSPLKNQRAAKYQVYEWKTDSFSDWHTLRPEGILILKGVYSLDRSVRDFFDLKRWIDFPPEPGLARGVARDNKRDGVDHSDQWKNIWMPLEEKHRKEQKLDQCADYVLNGRKLFEGKAP